MYTCMHTCLVLNGNVFGRYDWGIMIMNKDLCACLKGHLWDVLQGGGAVRRRWGKIYWRPYAQYVCSEASDSERIHSGWIGSMIAVNIDKSKFKPSQDAFKGDDDVICVINQCINSDQDFVTNCFWMGLTFWKLPYQWCQCMFCL